MRLIDADELLPKFCNNCSMFDECCVLQDERDCAVKRALKEAPTVIDPFKHGRWKMHNTYYKCSVCNGSDGFGLSAYCKNCGAKMDEEVDDD